MYILCIHVHNLLFPENSSPTMSDLYNWLHPLKEVTSNDSSKSISSLMGVVKDLTPLLSIHRPGKANSPIITSLRILLTYVRPSTLSGGQGKTVFTPDRMNWVSSRFICTMWDDTGCPWTLKYTLGQTVGKNALPYSLKFSRLKIFTGYG